MTRMTEQQERLRQAVEDPLFNVSRMLKEMELLQLRIDQALRRAPALEYLLQPVKDTLNEWRDMLSGIQRRYGSIWQEGNRRNWL